MTTKVYLGVGSNLNRDNALRFAKKELSALFSNVKCSSVWESRPVREAEPDYYNIVIGGDCDLSLDDLVAKITEIELAAGKEILSSMFEYYATEWASGKDLKDADKGDVITDSSLFEVKPGRVPYGTPAGETVDLTFTYKANSTVTPDPASNAEHITVI